MTTSVPPAPYLRLTSFTGFSPYRDAALGVSLDNEFNAVQVAVNALENRLALIQRGDGMLPSGSVGPDQLGVGLTAQKINSLTALGVNATNSLPNILTVGGPSALFTNTPAGTDHRLIVSKAAVANTASLLFQDNFSGRAEIGLTGDDNFHFKVSVNGVSFTDALDISTAGVVTTATAPVNDSTTRLATTAFVAASFAPKLNPVFTGTVSASAIAVTPVTIAGLPASPVSGQMAYIHDTVGNLAPAFHAVVAGGGAVTVDGWAYFDITTANWKWA